MRKALPWIYLLLAILGAILPWKANLEFIAEGGGQAFDLARFIADASSTAASRSLSADLLVGASAVTLWICVEGPARRSKVGGSPFPSVSAWLLPVLLPSFCFCGNGSCKLRSRNPRPERSRQS